MYQPLSNQSTSAPKIIKSLTSLRSATERDWQPAQVCSKAICDQRRHEVHITSDPLFSMFRQVFMVCCISFSTCPIRRAQGPSASQGYTLPSLSTLWEKTGITSTWGLEDPETRSLIQCSCLLHYSPLREQNISLMLLTLMHNST